MSDKHRNQLWVLELRDLCLFQYTNFDWGSMLALCCIQQDWGVSDYPISSWCM